jgi:archaellum component FlaC
VTLYSIFCLKSSNFRNAYEGPSDFDPINHKIEELENTVDTITSLNSNLLDKINRISEKLNTMDI